jgi:hypothetical protein
MVSSKIITALLLALAAGAPAGVQDRPHEHQDQLGSVHFVTSCNPAAQDEFNRGVALLHSFQFSRSIAGFNAALARDPGCAIAYWGIALSAWGNPFASGSKDPSQLRLGRDSAARGMALGAKSEREQAYLAAVGDLYDGFEDVPQRARVLAYRDAMQGVAMNHPEDHEAQIFYALSLASSEDPTDKTYVGRRKAGAVLEMLFEEEPAHPGLAHYIIHTYDVPALAGQALAAARRYAQIAPDAPHALHMPSHTFTRMGYWQESIDSNLAAAAAAARQGQTAEELHASDYQMYAYLQTGQDEAAGRLLKSLAEIDSRFDPKALLSGAGGPAVGYFALAAIPARYALERQDWQAASQLVVRETPFGYTDAISWYARGLGAARTGPTARAYEAASALWSIAGQLTRANEVYWAQQVEIQRQSVAAWAALAAGDKKHALMQMKSAAVLEDGTEKNAITPGPIAPARELLGDMLLELHEPAQALKQFQATLEKEPRRFRSLAGAAQAARLMGSRAESEHFFRALATVCAAGDRPGRKTLEEARAYQKNL